MKTKLLLACIIGLFSVTSAYAKCDGGTEITNTAGTTFCRSNVTMNWWSAYAWCRANGLRLATMYEICPSWDGNVGNGKCPELSDGDGGWAWSSTVRNVGSAFFVNPSGTVGKLEYGREEANVIAAICR